MSTASAAISKFTRHARGKLCLRLSILFTAAALVALCCARIPAQQVPVLPSAPPGAPPQSLAPAQEAAALAVPLSIGRIEGPGVVVKTSVGNQVETDAGSTVVASGSDITVVSGQALIQLDGGGEISVCGPAHLTLIKSGAALTLALDYGRVHPSLGAAQALTIYTPAIVATPVSIGGAAREVTVGLEQTGAMCVVSTRGAMRLDQQLSGQSVLVPQGGTIALASGQIESLQAEAAACGCEYSRTAAGIAAPAAPQATPTQPSVSTEISAAGHPGDAQPSAAIAQAALSDAPVYTVLMPALSFNAGAANPTPDPSPDVILLVRDERVRPNVTFHGHVAPAVVEAAVLPPPAVAPPAPQRDSAPASPPPKPTLMQRFRAFIRELMGTN